MLGSVWEFFFPAADRAYFDKRAVLAFQAALFAFRTKDSGRFTQQVALMDKFSWKAYHAGIASSLYCKRAAMRHYKLRSFTKMKAWFEQVLYTADKQLGFVAGFVNSGYPALQDAAVAVMGRSGNKKYVKLFGEQLLRRDRLAGRLVLLGALRSLADPAAVVYIRKRLIQKNRALPFKERYSLYRALGELGGAREEQMLLRRLNMLLGMVNKSRDEIHILLDALGKVGGNATLGFFEANIGRGSRLYKFRETILQGLQGMRRANPSGLLIRLASGTLAPRLYRAAVTSAARFGKLGQLSFFKKALKRFLKNSWPVEDLVALFARFEYSAVNTIFRTLIAAPGLNFNGAVGVVRTIIKNKDSAAGPILLRRLQKERDVQLIALFAGALGELKDKRSIVLLKKLTTHSAPGVRFVAAEAVRKITGEKIKVQVVE